METDSENRGRGRPETFPDEMLRIAQATTRGTSRRALQNHVYAGLIITELADHYKGDERLDWLISDEGAKWSLLAELGRLRVGRGDAAMYEAADWLLENQPKVKYAQAVLRVFRTGKRPPASADALYEVLRTALDDYRSTHPISDGAAEAALRMLLDDLRE